MRDQSGIDDLRRVFNGEIVLPGDAGYEERRRHFNAVYDKRPTVITRPVGTADVVAAVRFARAAGLEIAVSSGGKHMAGFSRTDGGLVVDLSLMRGVRVDPVERTAWVQGGANGGDLQAEALQHGLGGVIGWMRGTGVGGVTLHGGFGMLSGKLGHGAETILEAELVTAEGEVLRVAPDENPGLLWAVRGFAGNFGVVTWVKLRLCPVPDTVLAGSLVYDAESSPRVLGMLDEFVSGSSDDLTIFGAYTVLPAEDVYPEDMQGGPALMITVVDIADDPDRAEEHIRRLREAGPRVDSVERQGLFEFICSMDAYIIPGRQFYDNEQIGGVAGEAEEVLTAHAQALADGGHHGEIILVPFTWGRNPAVPSALPHGQKGTWSIDTGVYWDDPADDERNQAWSDSLLSELRDRGLAIGTVVGNMQQRPDVERHRRAHGEESWRRLQALKAEYDPENVFHLNHNIPPANH